jgi:putative membrane protein insertion efficiency factor
LITSLLKYLIRVYQKQGGSKVLLNLECNFTPTCSQYALEALEKHGLFKGIVLAYHRIRKCNKPYVEKKIYDPLI